MNKSVTSSFIFHWLRKTQDATCHYQSDTINYNEVPGCTFSYRIIAGTKLFGNIQKYLNWDKLSTPYLFLSAR